MNIHELMVQKYLNSVVAGTGGMSRPVLNSMVKRCKGSTREAACRLT